jgi:hypothetical protein
VVSDGDRPGKTDDEASLDVVVPRARTDDGEGVKVVRLRDRAIELGEVRPLRDGRAIPESAEVVSLTPRDDAPAWNVEVVVARRGPAQVASRSYRDNWDATFGESELN